MDKKLKIKTIKKTTIVFINSLNRRLMYCIVPKADVHLFPFQYIISKKH